MHSSDIKRRSYDYSLNIIRISNKLRLSPSTAIIRSQVIRSATSIGANIVESKYSPTKKDFVNFRYYSLKSTNETLYWLCLIRDLDLYKRDEVELLIAEGIELIKILYTIIKNVKKSNLQPKT